ncbi:MAG TPA: DMT family transporter [Paracoccaceae bacterium]|nr:DMT family transporter [Paracoccaceae bacterium]
MSRGAATLTGAVAVLLWSTLAVLSVGTVPVPPFQLNALAFSLGALVGFAWMGATGRRLPLELLGWPVWLHGVLGLFGYHALYFTALRNAPPAEAGLIAYLWPLLIVLFSGLLPGERLRALHLAGAGLGLAGAALLIGGGAAFSGEHAAGYAAAFGCALVWSGYSVLARRLGHAPTEAVTVFCAATALLSVPAHLWLETTAWPQGALGWLAVAGLGIGPVGLAFYVWDVGVKRGNIQLLGVMAYAAPLLSTLLLVFAGAAEPTLSLGLAAFLIVGGAGLAAMGSARR